MSTHDRLDPDALDALDDDYARATTGRSAREPLPDGIYHVRVERVEIAAAKTTGAPMLRWELRVCGAPHRGRKIWRHNMLGSEAQMRWLADDLRICGVELGKLSELPGRLEELLDIDLEVSRKTKGEWTNVYFRRRLAPASEVEAIQAPAIVDDSDIPF